MQHNLKPEVVPLVLEVLRDSPKITGRLARNDGGTMCFCFEGAVCEAYRRAHPDTSRWRRYNAQHMLGFEIDGEEVLMTHTLAGTKILSWATVDSVPPRIDDNWAAHHNDEGWSFKRFIKELTS